MMNLKRMGNRCQVSTKAPRSKELVPSFWLSVVYVCKTYLFRNTKITWRCVNYPHLSKQSEFAIPITHGATRVWKKTKFQGHAAPVRYLEDVEYVINQLSQSPPWSTATSNPCAYRLKINAAAGSMSENNDKSHRWW